MLQIPKTGQRNDCTVVALSLLTGESYDVVTTVLRTYKRRDNCGFRIYDWLREHNGYVLGHHFQLVYRHEQEGKFLVGNQGHCASIIDGKLHHRLDSGMRYSRCYKVTKAQVPDATQSALQRAQILAEL